MKHVVVVTTSFPAHPEDPAGHFVRTEARDLAGRGFRVTVLAAGKSSGRRLLVDSRSARHEEPYRLIWLGGRSLFGAPGALVRAQRNPLRVLAAFPVLARLLCRLPADADRIVCHWLPTALVVAPFTKAPVEAVAHGSDVRLLATLPTWALSGLLGSLLERKGHMRFVSAHLRDLLAERLVPHLAAVVRNSPVQPAPIDVVSTATREHWRTRLGLRAPHAVVVGRLVKSKRVEVALGALSLVPGLRITVLGDGPERTALQRAFPDARFMGQTGRDLTLGWILAADVLVSASKNEGAPTAIREARLLGTPVVASAWGSSGDSIPSDPELHVVG